MDILFNNSGATYLEILILMVVSFIIGYFFKPNISKQKENKKNNSSSLKKENNKPLKKEPKDESEILLKSQDQDKSPNLRVVKTRDRGGKIVS